MRRATLAITLAGVLIGTAACGGQKDDTAAAPSSATTSAAPTSAAPSPSDYTADTEKVCKDLEKSLDTGLKSFGTELGKMIGYRQAGNKALADKARTNAQKKADSLATTVRTKTAKAQDPEFKAAGAEAADNIATSADNKAFFDKMKTVKDLDKLESEISGWVTPLAGYCSLS